MIRKAELTSFFKKQRFTILSRVKVEKNNLILKRYIFANIMLLKSYGFLQEPPIPKTDIVHARVTNLVVNICAFPNHSMKTSCVLMRWSNAAIYDLSFCSKHNCDIRQIHTLCAAEWHKSEGSFFLVGNKTAPSVVHASDTTAFWHLSPIYISP